MPGHRGHRWHAVIYDLIMRPAERALLGPLRQRLAGQATGRVLEIGAGTGANFPYYAAAESVIAIEPDPFMLKRARQRARGLERTTQLVAAQAEALPFREASFDTAVVTLVLCSVSDVDQSVAETRRVLKPSGTLLFIEHVRAEGWLGQVQDLLAPLWIGLGAGCHPNRCTDERIRAGGFSIAQLERRPAGPTPLVAGLAQFAPDAQELRRAIE